MRPHRLRLQAFGPFAGEVEVDLDALAAGGLFLLHGETGAGKTTLLDGLGFALFGRVPGARADAGRLRSDHAPPGVRTEVELVVTLGGRRWRIVRSPAQQRPKTRGTGLTTEQARVLLQEDRGSGWETVSTRLDEAAAELDPLLGMSAEQFFQVVLLPQGEFARFLRARSEERGAVLQRLFATQRFKAVEEWLAARRAAGAARTADARAGVQVLVARCAQAAGCEAPEQVPPGWADGLLATARDSATLVAARAERAQAERDRLRADLEQVRALAGRQARRREALADERVLQAQAADHEALGRELTAAARAAELAAVLHDAADREAERSAAGAAERAARAGLPPVGVPVDAGLPVLRAAAEAASRRAGRLDGLRGLADELAAEQVAAASASADVHRVDLELADVGRLLDLLPARRTEAAVVLRSAEEAQARVPLVRADVAGLRVALADSRAAADAAAEREQLREEHLLARETAQSLREKEGELREARLVTMIAELADRLEPGSPCEVCGALDHPDPYEGAGEGVGREEEDRARVEREQAERAVAEVAARLAGVEATLAQLAARLLAAGHAGGDPGALQALLAERELALSRLEPLAERVPAARAAVEALEAEQAAVEAEQGRLGEARTAAERRIREAQDRAERLSARLSDELGGAPDLEHALGQCAAVQAVSDRAAGAAERALQTGREAAAAALRAETAAAAAGFAGVDAARAALRPAAWRAESEQRRRAYDNRVAALTAVLADPELDVALEQPADVAAAQAACAAAEAEVTREVGAAAATAGRLAQLEGLLPQVGAAQVCLRETEESHAQVRRLADLCAGGNGNQLRMSLSSFVLAARLEEVAAAASERLLRMTQGRYALAHTDGTAKGGARSGLGLVARDSWTGRDRETSTLSGGETFLASLALALGLADVVQAEAGGTRIEALFVDEGFGTLDEQTLDEVMDVLDGLREGGRVVGLVSHVAELRARIPAQVVVHKGRTGSTVSVLGC